MENLGNNLTDFVSRVFFTLAIFLLGIFIGLLVEQDTQRELAIEANVGEYYLDESNEKVFRFVTVQKVEVLKENFIREGINIVEKVK